MPKHLETIIPVVLYNFPFLTFLTILKGKFIEIHFDIEGRIVGAKIQQCKHFFFYTN
jgi:hypothetical protein